MRRGALADRRAVELQLRVRGWPQIKTGRYEIPAGASPNEILQQLAEGRVVLESLTVVEGWTFADMRRVVEAHPQIKVTLRGKDTAEFMTAIGHAGEHPEGRFFPDTYRFAAGTTDRELLRAGVSQDGRRHSMAAWAQRARRICRWQMPTRRSPWPPSSRRKPGSPANVRISPACSSTRLRRNMRLQTDPTVIYGIGPSYDGNIRERDLRTDTPYNTYTRAGLPPTPIALPSREAIEAVTHPLETGDIVLRRHRRGRRFACVLGDARRAQCGARPLSGTIEGKQIPMMQARFITLEGIEGAGKTTVADRITQSLRARGITVHATREPGGTKVAERIRALVLDRGEEHISATAETLLMFGARQIHVDNLIRPALARGEWVLCDRFTDATHAYQGGGRGVDRALIDRIAQAVHGDLAPDCTLLLDVPVRVGLERMQARRGAVDRFEVESAQFFDRVRNRYLELARARAEAFSHHRCHAAARAGVRGGAGGARRGHGARIRPRQ